MIFADAELRALAARATPLTEHASCGVVTDGTDCDRVDDRLQKWREALSVEGDPKLFPRMLALGELDYEKYRSWLGPVKLADDQPIPAWARRFNSWLRQVHQAAEVNVHHHIRADLSRGLATDCDFIKSDAGSSERLPFDDVWSYFVVVATKELRHRANDILENLAEDAVRGFQRDLLETLANLAALSMAFEFRLMVCKHDPLAIFRRTEPNNSLPSDDLYRRFVKSLLNGELLEFFRKYAVLARLIATAIDCWIDHIAEFCRRLEEDRSDLASQFKQCQDLGRIVKIKTRLSDPHQNGRTVIICIFECGLKLVCKPKDLAIDQAYWSFIDWLNKHAQSARHHCCQSNLDDCMLPLLSIRVLNRQTHGWVEFVEHVPCQSDADAELYYRRIGSLLCLTYVLGGADFHFENIIACGDQPVLIDLEAMLQPLPRPWDAQPVNSADTRAMEMIHHSVLRTGLLPFWTSDNRGRSFDMSGIGAEDAQETGFSRPQWEHINTDQMRIVYRAAVMVPTANVLMIGDKVVSGRNYVTAMENGFAATYRVLLRRREELLSDDGPLGFFRGLKLRCVLRATHAYAQMLRRLRHPEFLCDGADRSIELNQLARAFVTTDPQYLPPWQIYHAEVEALERLDIPYFSFRSDSESLLADDRVVAQHFFVKSGQAYLESRVRDLNEEDLATQINWIHATLHARFAHTQPREVHRASLDEPEFEPMTGEELVAAAITIANQIRASAIHGDDGSVTWISLQFDPTGERLNLLPSDDYLYNGRIGVALFLAALDRVTGSDEFHDLALSAVLPLRKVLQQSNPPITRRTALGGATGIGSQLYALSRIADWLHDAELFERAESLTDGFSTRRIAGDEALDVIGGAAGGILGLLAYSKAFIHRESVSAAIRCGDHLLEKRVRSDTGHRVWSTRLARLPLTGFAHGAAGIAYALLRLHQATGETRFRDAAAEAIDYETAVFSTEACNWPDLRDWPSQAATSYSVAWCAGATGIGLARLGGLPVFDSTFVRMDIENAILTTLAAAPSEVDHLCCGNLGRIDFLLEASLRLGRPDLMKEALRHATSVVCRATQEGRYRLHAQAFGVNDSSSLFQGTAGIGYALLRLANPVGLPCILMWE